MKGFESTLREVARRKLTGTRLTNTGAEPNYNGFIRFGVSVNRDAVNKIFADLGYHTLRQKYEVLEKFAKYLAWLSPVYTGYYVKNWQVNPRARSASSHISQEPNPMGVYYSTGAMRRRQRIESESEKSALKKAVGETLVGLLQQRFLEYEGTNTTALKDTWAFYNPTPYAEKIESKNGVIAGASWLAGL